jgi:hypothetical protein
MIGLGVVPLAFSALFWLVPALRAGSVARENERIRKENLKRLVYANAVASPAAVRVPSASELPAVAKPRDQAAARKVVEELAAYESGDPAEGGAWRLPELERKVADVQTVRTRVKPADYSLGDVAFDSGS